MTYIYMCKIGYERSETSLYVHHYCRTFCLCVFGSCGLDRCNAFVQSHVRIHEKKSNLRAVASYANQWKKNSLSNTWLLGQNIVNWHKVVFTNVLQRRCI